MRHLKQFFYGIFYLTLIGGVGSMWYYAFLKPAPTCYDNILNQGEEGVDCGGVCAKMCIPDLYPLSGSEVKFIILPFGSSTTRVSYLAEIRNSNLDWAAKDFIYTFRGFDAGGKEVSSVNGSSFIYAGEIKYIVSANVEASELPVRATIALEDPEWVKKADFEKPQPRVILGETNLDQIISSRGSVINDSPLPVNVDLIALYYNSAGEVIGMAPSNLARILPSETREFSIFHPVVEDVSLGSTRIISNSYYVK